MEEISNKDENYALIQCVPLNGHDSGRIMYLYKEVLGIKQIETSPRKGLAFF